jgi:hypothetical protein
MSVIDPTAFDARVQATTLVRGEMSASRASSSSPVARIERDGANGKAVVACDQQPGGHVGVVVELGDDDLVSRLEGPREGVDEEEVDRGGVGSKDHLFRGAAEEV